MGLASTPLFATASVFTGPFRHVYFFSRRSFPLPRKRGINFQRPSSFARNNKKTVFKVSCSSLVEVEEDGINDDETCELVNGIELSIGGEADDETIQAYLFKAVKNNNGTGLLLLSDVFGFQDSATRDFAYRVACNGYKDLINKVFDVKDSLLMEMKYKDLLDKFESTRIQLTKYSNVLVPDLFRGDPWSKDRPKAMFEQWIANQDFQRVGKDIAISTRWMVDEFLAAGISKKLGIIGFCFGGGRVIDVLAQDQGSYFGVGVSFYGTRMDQSVASNVKVPVLLISGDGDPLCPVNVLKDLEKSISSRGSRVLIFEGRGHGFAHRPRSPEEDEAAEQAFTEMRSWLHDGLVLNN